MLRYRIGFQKLMALIAKLGLLLLKQMLDFALVMVVAEKALARNLGPVNIQLRNTIFFMAVET
jgi:hypothetical protein